MPYEYGQTNLDPSYTTVEKCCNHCARCVETSYSTDSCEMFCNYDERFRQTPQITTFLPHQRANRLGMTFGTLGQIGPTHVMWFLGVFVISLR